MTKRSLTTSLENQLEVGIADARRLIDAVRSLHGDVGSTGWTLRAAGHRMPRTVDAERRIAATPVRIGRVLKRDYNYFDSLNESLSRLAQKEQNEVAQEPTISPY